MEDEESLKKGESLKKLEKQPKPNPVIQADLQLVKRGKQSVVSGGSMLPGRLRVRGIRSLYDGSTRIEPVHQMFGKHGLIRRQNELTYSLSPSSTSNDSSNTSKSSRDTKGYTKEKKKVKTTRRGKKTKTKTVTFERY